MPVTKLVKCYVTTIVCFKSTPSLTAVNKIYYMWCSHVNSVSLIYLVQCCCVLDFTIYYH